MATFALTYSDIDFEIVIDLQNNYAEVTSAFLESPFRMTIFNKDGVFKYCLPKDHPMYQEFSITRTRDGYRLYTYMPSLIAERVVHDQLLLAISDQLKKLARRLRQEESNRWFESFGFVLPRRGEEIGILDRQGKERRGKVVKLSPSHIFLFSYSDEQVWQIEAEQIYQIVTI